MLSAEEFDAEYRKGFPLTVRYLKHRFGKDCQAEELAQGAWALAWEKRASFRGLCPFHAWVGSIARVMRLNHGRYDKYGEHEIKLPRLEDLPHAYEPASAYHLWLEWNRQWDSLSPSNQRVLELFMLGYSYAEISQELGLSFPGVWCRLLRIRRAWRKRWR